MFNFKTGAMFGLDARIALAIFGALSVISGASLYSAIQQAKATSFYTTIVELEKSIEALILDLGYMPKTSSGAPDFSYLSGNRGNLSSWRGPYFDLDYFGSESSSFRKEIGNSFPDVYFLNGGAIRGAPTACNGSSGSTYSYIRVGAYNSEAPHICSMDWDFIKTVHDLYDSDGDYNSGKIIVRQKSDDVTKGSFIYKLGLDLGSV
tara:strand:+ start:1895 stop:2512 length:618 start_codon:yes stop_codon:yes gene_type:complete